MAVCEKLFELSKDHPILSKVVEDRTALEACISFAKDHRILVEPACGAVLSAVYAELLKEDLVRATRPHLDFWTFEPDLFIKRTYKKEYISGNSCHRRRGRVRSSSWCAGVTWRAPITSSSG